MRRPFGQRALLALLFVGGLLGGLSWVVIAGPTPSPLVSAAESPAAAPTAAANDEPAARPAVRGLLTFRGNASRTYYGEGPVPKDPEVVWSYPDRAMCSDSTAGGDTKEWCGTGWTGQPAVFRRNRLTWLVVGAYDRNLHFVDADSGEPLLRHLRPATSSRAP